MCLTGTAHQSRPGQTPLPGPCSRMRRGRHPPLQTPLRPGSRLQQHDPRRQAVSGSQVTVLLSEVMLGIKKSLWPRTWTNLGNRSRTAEDDARSKSSAASAEACKQTLYSQRDARLEGTPTASSLSDISSAELASSSSSVRLRFFLPCCSEARCAFKACGSQMPVCTIPKAAQEVLWAARHRICSKC